MDKPYLAHRREDTGEEQLLIDHLRGTAELAGEFGKYIHAEEQARRCGRIHDIGKGSYLPIYVWKKEAPTWPRWRSRPDGPSRCRSP